MKIGGIPLKMWSSTACERLSSKTADEIPDDKCWLDRMVKFVITLTGKELRPSDPGKKTASS